MIYQAYGPESELVSAIVSPTVIVAEDSGDTRHMLRRALEIKGYHVLEARNGNEAVNLAREYRPHLIIVDLNMPELDGLETIKKVLRQVNYNKTKAAKMLNIDRKTLYNKMKHLSQ